VESGEPIPDARLEALPLAERTVEEQARLEGGL
jgi:RNA polymerase-binding transcription factor DksA